MTITMAVVVVMLLSKLPREAILHKVISLMRHAQEAQSVVVIKKIWKRHEKNMKRLTKKHMDLIRSSILHHLINHSIIFYDYSFI